MPRIACFLIATTCALLACSEPYTTDTSGGDPTKTDPSAASNNNNNNNNNQANEANKPATPDPANTIGSQASALKLTRTLGIVLYKSFELLDVYGPVEMFGYVGPQLKVVMIAEKAGPVASSQGPKVIADFGFDDAPPLDLMMVPGGFGSVPELVGLGPLLDFLRTRAKDAELVLSVCTGSALLARAGLLDGYKATSNKLFFSMARVAGPKVNWIEKARWVEDRDRVTSSGVSAGIDMSLAVIARLWGDFVATKIAYATEYTWHRDPNDDPFFQP